MMNDNIREFDNQKFHELLSEALETLPIQNFTIQMGDKCYQLRHVMMALRDLNVQWMAKVNRQAVHIQDMHHDLTITLGILARLTEKHPETAPEIRQAVSEMRTARIVL